MNKSCIIHYDGHEKYSKIKDLSDNNEERIRKAKTIRETINGKHYHKKQCYNEVHGVHMKPCLNKFT